MWTKSFKEFLDISNIIKEMKIQISKGGFFEGLINKYLLHNNKKYKIIMRPSTNNFITINE